MDVVFKHLLWVERLIFKLTYGITKLYMEDDHTSVLVTFVQALGCVTVMQDISAQIIVALLVAISQIQEHMELQGR